MKAPWDRRLFIIAEAGVNHNGDLKLAKKLVDAAAEAKADAVKFQTWKEGEIVGRFSHKVGYLKKTTGDAQSFLELARKLCLPYSAFAELQKYSRKRGILFLSTPDGFESLDFLARTLRMPYIKIGSTEVTHPQLLEAAGAYGRPVILSTGLSQLTEIGAALKAVRRRAHPPVALLQCTSEYPAPYEEINLRAMTTIQDAFGVPVGLSDHSRGFEAAVAAVALGACVIEKHFTLDKRLPGPDHQASLDPAELTRFVSSLRATQVLLGDGIKRPTAAERRNMDGIRRSVVAKRPLPKGTVLRREDLVCLRPGWGIPPKDLERVIGKTTKRALEQDEPFRWADVR